MRREIPQAYSGDLKMDDDTWCYLFVIVAFLLCLGDPDIIDAIIFNLMQMDT